MSRSAVPRVQWSEREREVLDLIVDGRTNGEIAEELGISFATAKWHVSELITKLGVSSREEVADAWRRERGFTRRLGRLATAVVGLPALKLAAAGGAAAVVCLTGAIAWASFGGNEGTAATPDVTATATAAGTASPTATPRGLSTVSRPPGCATEGTGATRAEAAAAFLCPVLNYPEIAAKNSAASAGGCVLTGAVVGNSGHMDSTDFRGCTLDGATLSGTLNGSTFEGVSARGLTAHTTIANSDFRGADLTGADLSGSVLQNADFTDATLLGADLTDAIIRGANLSNTVCPDGTNSDAIGGSCIGTHWVEDYWPVEHDGWVPPACQKGGVMATRLCATNLYAGVTVGADGKSCSAAGADLHGRSLKSADFAGCDFTGANLSGADLEGASFSGASLAGANLSDAKLAGTDARDASFRGANLAGANMSHTSLQGADLTGATTTDAFLRAEYKATICPDGTNSDRDDGDNQTCANNR